MGGGGELIPDVLEESAKPWVLLQMEIFNAYQDEYEKNKNDHIVITWDYYFSVTISSKQLIPFTDFTIKSLYDPTSFKQQQAQFILVDDEGFPLSQCQGVSK